MENKKNKHHQNSILIRELAKQRPILTEEEINSFCTFEEIITDAKEYFDTRVKNIIKEYDNCKNK